MNRRGFMKMCAVAAVGAVLPLPVMAAGAPVRPVVESVGCVNLIEVWLKENLPEPFYRYVVSDGKRIIHQALVSRLPFSVIKVGFSDEPCFWTQKIPQEQFWKEKP